MGYKRKTKLSPNLIVKNVTFRQVEVENDSVIAGPSGAKSSKTNLYYHDIPPVLFRRLALRHTVGHKKHNDNPVPITMNLNWRQGLDDPFYVMDRLNHMFEHMIAFLEDGDGKDDNLAAVVWNAGFLMEVERLSPALINQVIGQSRYHGIGDIASSAEGKKKDLQIVQKVKK